MGVLADRHTTAIAETGELLYEFLRGHTRVRCELVDHGQCGFEALIFHNDEHYMSHTFAPWHCIPFASPRAAAMRWAKGDRNAIEKDEDD
jgi:hypothetical protein